MSKKEEKAHEKAKLRGRRKKERVPQVTPTKTQRSRVKGPGRVRGGTMYPH